MCTRKAIHNITCGYEPSCATVDTVGFTNDNCAQILAQAVVSNAQSAYSQFTLSLTDAARYGVLNP